MKKRIEIIKIKVTILKLLSWFIYASGRMCNVESPNRAPQANEYSIEIKILKEY